MQLQTNLHPVAERLWKRMDLPPSLRSLALLSLPLDQLHITNQPLPPSVASDLVAINIFGDTFVREIRKNGIIHRISLTISFDGVAWIFSYKSFRTLVPCCYSCSQQEQHQHQPNVKARISESTAVPFFTPFPLFHQWVNDRSGYTRLPDLTIKCTLKKDGRGGSLKLSGQIGGFGVTSEFMVSNSLVEGRKVLRHKGSVTHWTEQGGWVEEQMAGHLAQPDLFLKVEPESEQQQKPLEALTHHQGLEGFQPQSSCPCKSSAELWWGHDSDSAPRDL